MTTTNAHPHATPRRTRLGGLVASLVVTAAVLAGCSAASPDATDSRVDLGYANAGAPNAGAPDAAASFAENARSAPVTNDRSVIITGGMYMTVEDPIAAADRATSIVKSEGGRIDARREIAPDGGNGGSASLTLRIPSQRLDQVIYELRKLGKVDQFSTSAYDVTTQVTDLDAKISTLRASTTRLASLMATAKDMSDIITLENELDRRQAELQSLEAQQRGLDDQVAMTTIDLSLTTEPVVIVEEEGPTSFWGGLVSGWDALVGFLSGTLVVIGVLLPWIGLAVVVIVPTFIALRARRSRVAREAVASTKTATPKKPAAPRKAVASKK